MDERLSRKICLLNLINIFISYSEAGQDAFAFQTINRRNGSFLDVGANDPFWNNNSYGLEKIGWKGLLVDFDPAMIQLCRANRTNPVIEADASKVDWLKVCAENGLSNEIDYLSLDVDDYLHCGILNNFISDGFSFKVITVEHDFYANGEEPRNSIRKILLSNGYTLAVPDVKCSGGPFEDWYTNAKV